MHPETKRQTNGCERGAPADGGGAMVVLDALGIGLVALAVRMVFAAGIPIPPADDPAYYVTVARNLYEGRGFVSDVIWQYAIPFDSLMHPAGELWMPLPSWLMCLVFLAAGPSWRAAQAPGVLAGSGLAALTYLVGRSILTGQSSARALAWASGLLVAFNGLLAYQSASADSSAPFALLAALALWLVGGGPLGAAGEEAVRRASWMAVGILLGLAYLSRSDVLFVVLGLALACWTAHRTARHGGWRLWHLLLAGLVAGVVVAPWLMRNVLAFGSPFPAPAARLALLTKYDDLFSYANPLTLDHWWSQGLSVLLTVRLDALWHSWHGVLDFLFFPTALLPATGLWLLRRRFGVVVVGWALVATLLATALVFPIVSRAGTFYHDVGAFAPWLGVGSVYAIKRGLGALAAARKWKQDFFWLTYGALLLVTVLQLALSLRAASIQHMAEQRRLAEAASWLAAHPSAVVISTVPYNLDYLTRQPGLMLPLGEGPGAVKGLAARYGARYVVVTGDYGLYPGVFRQSAGPCGEQQIGDVGLCLAYDGTEVQVFAIQ